MGARDMNLTLQELKEKIVQLYDPDDIVEALELSTEELLDAFEDKLIEQVNKFNNGDFDE